MSAKPEGKVVPLRPAAGDESLPLRWSRVALSDASRPLAADVSDLGEGMIYRWSGACWELQPPRDLEQQAFAWLSACAPKRATATMAAECHKALWLALLADTGRRLHKPARDPVAIGTLDHDLLFDRHGRMRAVPHDPAHGLTHLIQAPLDARRIGDDGTYAPRPPAADSVWGRFLARIMPEADLQSLLQEIAGATLLPITLERFFMLLGDGANGKSTFIHVITALHADSAVSLSADSITGRFFGQTIIGKSLATLTEMTDYAGDLMCQRIKALASRDGMFVDRKNQQPLTYVPRCTLFIAANTPVRFHDQSDGLLRKMLQLPFPARLEPHERITDHHRSITENPREMAAVLDWALLGAQRLAARGYRFDALPESIQRIAAEQRASADPVYAWVQAHEVRHDESVRASKGEIYRHYAAWSADNGRKNPLAAESFWRQVRALVMPRNTDLPQWRGSPDTTGVRPWLVPLRVEGVPHAVVAQATASVSPAGGRQAEPDAFSFSRPYLIWDAGSDAPPPF